VRLGLSALTLVTPLDDASLLGEGLRPFASMLATVAVIGVDPKVLSLTAHDVNNKKERCDYVKSPPKKKFLADMTSRINEGRTDTKRRC
jgi:hypothetical protein